VQLLDTIPGIARNAAEILVSEIGTDMNLFPTANLLAAWAGVVPGNNESAGKQYSGRTRPGNKVLKDHWFRLHMPPPAPEILIFLLNITVWQVDVEKNVRSWLSPILY
jgi:hypothetical protein